MEMIRIDQVLADWSEDSKIDKILVDETALVIACRHQKYLDIQMRAKRQLRELKANRTKLIRKTPEYIAHAELLAETEDIVEACEKIIYSINQMSFTIGSIVKWRMWSQGSVDGL
jgi:ApbE superfamily uncharacterized protein (UPF0280 family)